MKQREQIRRHALYALDATGPITQAMRLNLRARLTSERARTPAAALTLLNPHAQAEIENMCDVILAPHIHGLRVGVLIGIFTRYSIVRIDWNQVDPPRLNYALEALALGDPQSVRRVLSGEFMSKPCALIHAGCGFDAHYDRHRPSGWSCSKCGEIAPEAVITTEHGVERPERPEVLALQVQPPVIQRAM